MNTTEFALNVDELLAKIDALGVDDYHTGLNIVNEFKTLAFKHRHYLSSDITDSASLIESDFDKVRRYKDSRNIPRQYEHYRSATSLLRHVIMEMKQSNQLPE
jgi:hypothetical protein